MHHKILVKIKADNIDEARDEAKSYLENSIDASENTVGWDYLNDDIITVTEEDLKQHGVKTFKALEKAWLKSTSANYRDHLKSLKDIFFTELVKRHLSGTKVKTYVGYKDRYGFVVSSDSLKKKDTSHDPVGDALRHAARKKIVKPLPIRLDTLAEEMVDIVNPKTDMMIEYHIRQLDKLDTCKRYPKETHTTLQCSDNHFADLNGEGTETYYFIFDRHF